ncbi:hypothetical protein JZ751_019026 [Albula glossodonta]|uniref:Wnt ligand secretion mediator n=1 Tax=Albula glossodonta TaxID=121402 RepID=A0A8T2NQY9_9TELE|nr:hypothetical protein JZ751_019026 [Albula glossodonta]
MAGAIIENMSTKKLIIVGVILILFQILSFLLGGLIAPSPMSAVQYLASKCVDFHKSHQQTRLSIPWGPNQCEKIRDFDEAMARHIEAKDITFAIHLPFPHKEMSPWFQFIVSILQLDIAFKVHNQVEEGAVVTLDMTVAYRDDLISEWTEMAHSVEQRKLSCNTSFPKRFKNEGRFYECDVLPFMELGNVAHKFYLINVRLPVNERKRINVGIGEIKDLRLVSIHQNGGFTKIWFAMKTLLTPFILITVVWYWTRITALTRPPILLEKTIFALGISMTFINIPVEWLSFSFDWTWMLLFGDIRQGIFYSTLLSFWIIFCGEHLMDETERNRFSVYWKQVGPIAFGSFSMFIFDMCERGIQLKNPFYSIWTSDMGTELAMAFIIVAGICACLYFLFLCFMVFQVFRNIGWKRSSLPAMSKARQLHYEVSGDLRFIGEYPLRVNSAFFTGMYGTWNLYVFAVMFLYAPSHKRHGDVQSSGDPAMSTGEDVAAGHDGPPEIYRISGKESQE